MLNFLLLTQFIWLKFVFYWFELYLGTSNDLGNFKKITEVFLYYELSFDYNVNIIY